MRAFALLRTAVTAVATAATPVHVMWAVATRMDPARDITIVKNTPIDYPDFASPESGPGSKIGHDATNMLPPETKRDWPPDSHE